MDKNKTLGELAKENPDKTYNELTRIQEDARLKKEGICITAALKKDIKGSTFEEERKKFKKEIDYHRYWKDIYEREHKLRQEAQGETTFVKGIGMNSPEMKALKEKNQELKKETCELRQDNRKLSKQIEDQVARAREAGM